MASLERRTLFEHTTEEPTVVSWAEVSDANEQGWRRCHIAFGLGSGAIRSTQVRFDEGNWSMPDSDGITIAGGLEASVRPGMQAHELSYTMRTFWEPATAFRALSFNDPERLFGGNFARSDADMRQFFTSPNQTWQYLAELFHNYDVLDQLPAIYYGMNLSQFTQLSRENQAKMGSLAGSFTAPQGHIHHLTMDERTRLETEGSKLRKSIEFINGLQAFKNQGVSDIDLRDSVDNVVSAARERAQTDVTPNSVILDTAGFAPFSEFTYDAKELVTREQTIASWGIALAKLDHAETEFI